MDQKETIGVIGSGTMGNGIAHVSSLSGYKVFLIDVNDDFLDRAMNTISSNLDKQISKKIISNEDLICMM